MVDIPIQAPSCCIIQLEFMTQDNYKLKDLEKQFKDKTGGGHGGKIVPTTDVTVRGGAACIYHPDKEERSTR